MSEQTSDGYDPAQDQDSDPDSLQPRTGSRASGADDAGTSAGDPDADPDMLNPREDVQSGDEL